MIKKAELEKKKLASIFFNKKKIVFLKNKKSVEINNIGVIKFRNVEINHFTADGTLLDHMPINNYTAGIKLTLTKYDEPLFYSDKTLFVKN